MAFNFSAMQFDRRFRATGLNNWEYPRFSPSRPRSFRLNAAAVCDKNGHLLPTARRDGNSFGRYRCTYELPLRITRSFIALYDACLSGRYKYRDFPRDLCSCNRMTCDTRVTLGTKGDPYWDKPNCQSKCEGVYRILNLHERSLNCKKIKKCLPLEGEQEKLIRPPRDTVLKGNENKRNRKRQVTAFARSRKVISSDDSSPARSNNASSKAKANPKNM